jgi:hypothetical protein
MVAMMIYGGSYGINDGSGKNRSKRSREDV